jgi:uncharacterized damage-inducible protein DinB
MSTTTIQQQFRHNRWANRLILDACRSLSAEQLRATCVGTYGALGPTLAHLASAEAGYTHRLSGEPRHLLWGDQDPLPPVAQLAEVLDATGTRLIALATDVPGDRVITFVTLDGETVSHPAWVLLAQSIDHGREHRSHIATILTQLGIAPPDIDVWAFEESGEADR